MAEWQRKCNERRCVSPSRHSTASEGTRKAASQPLTFRMIGLSISSSVCARGRGVLAADPAISPLTGSPLFSAAEPR